MKQWKHPAKGTANKEFSYMTAAEGSVLIILPEREHNTRGLHNAWRAAWLRVQGPGPVPVFQGKRTEQNKTKSDWIKVTSHVITFLLWLYIGIYLYTEQEAIWKTAILVINISFSFFYPSFR